MAHCPRSFSRPTMYIRATYIIWNISIVVFVAPAALPCTFDYLLDRVLAAMGIFLLGESCHFVIIQYIHKRHE